MLAKLFLHVDIGGEILYLLHNKDLQSIRRKSNFYSQMRPN